MSLPPYFTQLGISSTTVVKIGPGFCQAITVTISGGAGGMAYDGTAVSGSAVVSGSPFAPIGGALGVTTFTGDGWPLQFGLVIVPPSGGTVNVSFK